MTTPARHLYGDDYIAGGGGRRHDLRPARQRHDPGRRLDRRDGRRLPAPAARPAPAPAAAATCLARASPEHRGRHRRRRLHRGRRRQRRRSSATWARTTSSAAAPTCSRSTRQALRPDGSDLIFGGAGHATIGRNDAGAPAARHATPTRSSATTATSTGWSAATAPTRHVVPARSTTTPTPATRCGCCRARSTLLDYTAGRTGLRPTCSPAHAGYDVGRHRHRRLGQRRDPRRGRRRPVYAGGGNDVVFGDAGDDDLIGGWGNDWISGGTGDGRRPRRRRPHLHQPQRHAPSRSTASPPRTTQVDISTPGNVQTADALPDRPAEQDRRPDAVQRSNPSGTRRQTRCSRRGSPTTSSTAASATTSCTAAPATTRSPAPRRWPSPTPRARRHGALDGVVAADWTTRSTTARLLGFDTRDRRVPALRRVRPAPQDHAQRRPAR